MVFFEQSANIDHNPQGQKTVEVETPQENVLNTNEVATSALSRSELQLTHSKHDEDLFALPLSGAVTEVQEQENNTVNDIVETHSAASHEDDVTAKPKGLLNSIASMCSDIPNTIHSLLQKTNEQLQTVTSALIDQCGIAIGLTEDVRTRMKNFCIGILDSSFSFLKKIRTTGTSTQQEVSSHFASAVSEVFDYASAVTPSVAPAYQELVHAYQQHKEFEPNKINLLKRTDEEPIAVTWANWTTLLLQQEEEEATILENEEREEQDRLMQVDRVRALLPEEADNAVVLDEFTNQRGAFRASDAELMLEALRELGIVDTEPKENSS